MKYTIELIKENIIAHQCAVLDLEKKEGNEITYSMITDHHRVIRELQRALNKILLLSDKKELYRKVSNVTPFAVMNTKNRLVYPFISQKAREDVVSEIVKFLLL